ncbi:MAG: hypothetical protein Fur0046_18420 [Cyanobacteria bacterium J069]|nr:MAG: class I SAM-dependent methyltransferase [Cyanobacteria bacterium J069]
MRQTLTNWILGVHPNNTCFAFNWHNVRHIRRFLGVTVAQIEGTDLRLADVGGGRSPYYPFFASKASQYLVIDLAEALPQGETRPIKQLVGTAEEIPLGDREVDIVLCNQVLEHVLDPVQSMREMDRILKPGGYFIGSVPHVSPIHLEPYDYRRYTALGIKQLLQQQGYEGIKVEGNGGVFRTAALMIAMDLLLSKRQPGRSQQFNADMALLLSPLIALLNLSSLLADKLFGDRQRTPANLCWVARKKLT